MSLIASATILSMAHRSYQSTTCILWHHLMLDPKTHFLGRRSRFYGSRRTGLRINLSRITDENLWVSHLRHCVVSTAFFFFFFFLFFFFFFFFKKRGEFIGEPLFGITRCNNHNNSNNIIARAMGIRCVIVFMLIHRAHNPLQPLLNQAKVDKISSTWYHEALSHLLH